MASPVSTAVKIEGLAELRAALQRAEGGFPTELRRALNEAARLVARGASPKVPVLTGRLQSSVKEASTQREGRVTMGNASVPYAGWIEFGGAVGRNKSVERARVPEGRYLYPAYEARQAEVGRTAEEALNRVTIAAGLT